MNHIVMVRNGEVKLTLPENLLRTETDGTIWKKEMPLLVCPDGMNKNELSDLVKSKKFDQIPADCFLKMGENAHGAMLLTAQDWANHPLKKQKEAEQADLEAKQVKIYLSSRGWGDYSAVEWVGDITRPDSEIFAECKAALENAYDVDEPNQTDADLLDKISNARAKWQKNIKEKPDREKAESERLQELVDSGYCFNCESWCHGDCGAYSNDPATKHRMEFQEAIREESSGIND